MLEKKFLGCMIGSALGDAIGEMAFFSPDREALEARAGGSDRLIYTDDTAMALGLVESISRVGGLDSGDLGDTFRRNFRREPWRGYASGPPTVFGLVERYNLSYPEAAKSLFSGQGSYGNGAAMRIGPVGLYFYDAGDLYEQAGTSAAVTHTHPIGIDGAAVLARAVAMAVELDPYRAFSIKRFGRSLAAFARTEVLRNKLELLEHLVSEETPAPRAASKLGRGVAVQDSLPFALYAFLRNAHSFEECLFCAVLNGGDCDTLGAMACAVSGAYLGLDALPAIWIEKLENLHYISELASGLYRAKVSG